MAFCICVKLSWAASGSAEGLAGMGGQLGVDGGEVEAGGRTTSESRMSR
jgi:hypothetical protein